MERAGRCKGSTLSQRGAVGNGYSTWAEDSELHVAHRHQILTSYHPDQNPLVVHHAQVPEAAAAPAVELERRLCGSF